MNERERSIIDTVKFVMAQKPLFFDTETTGIDARAEAVSIGIINYLGEVQLDRLILPRGIISPEAEKVHGMSEVWLRENGAKPFETAYPLISAICTGRLMVAYNATYDIRILDQSAYSANVDRAGIPWLGVIDAMQLYATFWGELRPDGRGYRWVKLESAINQCGVHLDIDKRYHSAVFDAQMTLALFKHLASL